MSLFARNLSELEKTVIDNVNSSYLIERKSSEVHRNEEPLTIGKEVRQIAAQYLNTNDVFVPESFLKDFLDSKSFDTKKLYQNTGWDIFWAQEMVAAMMKIGTGGGKYDEYLPGRFLHYDLIAHYITSLFSSGNGTGISNKEILELGSGSGIGDIRLAAHPRYARVTGLDKSMMAVRFGEYLAEHYGVSDRVTFEQGDYLKTGMDSGKFDATYSSGTFEHLRPRDAKMLLDEMIRVTDDGGHIIITIPNDESSFYKSFKDNEGSTKKEYPGIVEIPVEHTRNHPDIKRLMVEANLTNIREDGILVAPSSYIKHGDINRNDLETFNYLPEQRDPLSAENKIAQWTTFELVHTDPSFRICYGWSLIYSGEKSSGNGNTTNLPENLIFGGG